MMPFPYHTHQIQNWYKCYHENCRYFCSRKYGQAGKEKPKKPGARCPGYDFCRMPVENQESQNCPSSGCAQNCRRRLIDMRQEAQKKYLGQCHECHASRKTVNSVKPIQCINKEQK